MTVLEPEHRRFVAHDLMVRSLGAVRVMVFEDGSGSVLIKGEPRDGSLVRVQSACQYGELWGSVECDCRAQLDESLRRIRIDGVGIVIHLNQEGRGQGLLTKALAYEISKREGIDSFQAYQRLDVPLDSRRYDAAVDLLGHLAIGRVRLLTNNPHKIHGLEQSGIEVSREPLIKVKGEECKAYFASKVVQGHLAR